MPSIPSPVRACLGLLDATVERARELVNSAPDLPLQLVGNALQLSMKAQQQFTELTIRGDDVLGRLRGAPAEPPSWATFDDELPPTPAPATKASQTTVIETTAPETTAIETTATDRQTQPTAASPANAPAVKAGATKRTATAKNAAPHKQAAPAKKAAPHKQAPPAENAASARKTSPRRKPPSARPVSKFDLAGDLQAALDEPIES